MHLLSVLVCGGREDRKVRVGWGIQCPPAWVHTRVARSCDMFDTPARNVRGLSSVQGQAGCVNNSFSHSLFRTTRISVCLYESAGQHMWLPA